MKMHLPIVIVLFGFLLSACSSLENAAQISDDLTIDSGLTRSNDSAAVSVEVTPLNLDQPSATTLDFSVVLNTHSVDLRYDLATIAVLRADNGEEVTALKWDGPTDGGHHVRGVLSFPKFNASTQSVMLVLRDIAGVSERIFEWRLTS